MGGVAPFTITAYVNGVSKTKHTSSQSIIFSTLDGLAGGCGTVSGTAYMVIADSNGAVITTDTINWHHTASSPC